MISPLRDPVAAADHLAVRHIGDFEARDRRRGGGNSNMAAVRREVGAIAHPVHVAVLVFDIADQDHAAQAIVLEQQFLVNAERRVFVTDRLDAGLRTHRSNRRRRFPRP